MLSKEESKHILDIIVKRNIDIGSILVKNCVNTKNYIIVVGMNPYNKNELVVKDCKDNLPTTDLGRYLRKVCHYMKLDELKDYEVYDSIDKNLFNMTSIQVRIAFKDTLQEARVLSKTRVGTLLNFNDLYCGLVVSICPFTVIKISCDKNIREKDLINKLVNEEITVYIMNNLSWKLVRGNTSYIKSFNEKNIRKVINKLRIVGKI